MNPDPAAPLNSPKTYLGLALVAMNTLAVQICMTRLLSFAFWYHLAFLAISICMLGMTAGAIRVYLRPRPAGRQMAADCVWSAVTTCVATAAFCLIPFPENLQGTAGSLQLLGAVLVAALPFYFSGSLIAQVLAASKLPAGRLYASDLAGAAAGCLLVLLSLRWLDAPSALFFYAGLIAAVAVVFHPAGKWALRGGGLLVVLALLNAATDGRMLRAHHSKGVTLPSARESALSRWNSFSHVLVKWEAVKPAIYWGRAPTAPEFTVPVMYFMIDGLAGTPMHPFPSTRSVPHLEYDITNAAYHLGRKGPVAVIGVGGGRDVQSALLFGHTDVTGIEINPIVIGAHQGPFRDYSRLAGRDDVRLVVDDGRAWLSRSTNRYAFIQMSMVDTWAATGAGAFSLTENGLYTEEAWRIFLGRLAPEGILTVSRWHNPSKLGETGRLVSLAVSALLSSGATNPADHMAMLTINNISTLMVCRAPLRPADGDAIRALCTRMGFIPAFLPGTPPDNSTLASLLAAKDFASLDRTVRDSNLPYNIAPSTDDCPFFFNMLKRGDLLNAFRLFGKGPKLSSADSGIVEGNLHAEHTLVVLILACLGVSILTSIVPLLLTRRTDALRRPGFVGAAALFCLIGFGFMCVEIGLMQRLSAFLGQPTLALSVLLFTLILSTGAGSLLSENLSRRAVLILACLTAPMAALLPGLLGWTINAMEASPLSLRIVASLALTAPIGFLMGLFFPTGLRLVRAAGFTEVAWFWALNGVCGTLASGCAVYISIHFGISTTLYTAVVCYVLAAASLIYLSGKTKTLSSPA